VQSKQSFIILQKIGHHFPFAFNLQNSSFLKDKLGLQFFVGGGGNLDVKECWVSTVVSTQPTHIFSLLLIFFV
jgi:hypothetical protein